MSLNHVNGAARMKRPDCSYRTRTIFPVDVSEGVHTR